MTDDRKPSRLEQNRTAVRKIATEKTRLLSDHIVVRLGDELEKMLAIGSYLRECLQVEIEQAVGAGVPKNAIKQFSELAKTLDSVVSAKVRFDKAAKQMADIATPLEERNAVIQYLKAAHPEDAKEVWREYREWQDRRPGPGRPPSITMTFPDAKEYTNEDID